MTADPVYAVEDIEAVRPGLFRYWITCAGTRQCHCLHKGSKAEAERGARKAVKRLNELYGGSPLHWRKAYRKRG